MDGFKILGFAHICMILCILICNICLLFLFKLYFKKSNQISSNKFILLIISLTTILSEAVLDLYLVVKLHYNILYYLPLHLCGIGYFIHLGIAVTMQPHKKIIRIFHASLSEISMILIGPAAFITLFFPDWSNLKLTSYQSIQGFISHGLLILFPSILLFFKISYPDIKHSWYNIAFLVIIAIPIHYFNKYSGCNYLFLESPIKNTPLELMADIAGRKNYIYCLIIFITIIVSLEYLIFGFIHMNKFKNR